MSACENPHSNHFVLTFLEELIQECLAALQANRKSDALQIIEKYLSCLTAIRLEIINSLHRLQYANNYLTWLLGRRPFALIMKSAYHLRVKACETTIKLQTAILSSLQRLNTQKLLEQGSAFSAEKITFLECFYSVEAYPSNNCKQLLGVKLRLSMQQVDNWFKTHRYRIKCKAKAAH